MWQLVEVFLAGQETVSAQAVASVEHFAMVLVIQAEEPKEAEEHVFPALVLIEDNQVYFLPVMVSIEDNQVYFLPEKVAIEGRFSSAQTQTEDVEVRSESVLA